MTVRLAIVLLTVAAAMPPASAVAAPLEPVVGWFVEGSAGTVQPGPDGTDFGAGQDYTASVGYAPGPRLDGAFIVAWENARREALALETNVTSGGVRCRAWLGAERWSSYAALGARLYRFSQEVRSAGAPFSEDETHFGGEAAAGVRYRRSTWWLGLEAGVHAAIGSSSSEGGDLLTFTTYRLFIGAPTGW